MMLPNGGLDDLDLHNTQIEQHQVKPDRTVGLTPENVKQAVNILMGNIDERNNCE